MVICGLYFIQMNRGNSNTGSHRWEHYEGMPVSGSLIVNSQISPKNYGQAAKSKLEQYGFKHTQLVRHESEKQFKKHQPIRPPPYFFDHQSKQEDQGVKHSQIATRTGEIYTKRTNSKGTEKQPYFRARNSGGKHNNPLTQTMSTQSTEGLTTYKSERTFPSFLRSQTKSPQKFKIPQTLSKQNFKIMKKLGEGKFGNVYLAKEIATGFIVGLKVIEKAKIKKDNFLLQFTRQLRIQSFLDHPNIIKIYGYFHDEQQFYIIMQLGCDGQLYDIIAGGHTLSEQATSFVIGNLLEAINLMHSKKILHRDIKPQNIVLVHGNVKLCDFGWAVYIKKNQQLRSTYCGTPLYLSPQLVSGFKYDEKVDLWSVGILTYELYYGKIPFDINDTDDLLKIETDEIEYSKSKPISPEFREFFEAILKKNPKERKDCQYLMTMEFIKKYRELQTCEEVCQ